MLENNFFKEEETKSTSHAPEEAKSHLHLNLTPVLNDFDSICEDSSVTNSFNQRESIESASIYKHMKVQAQSSRWISSYNIPSIAPKDFESENDLLDLESIPDDIDMQEMKSFWPNFVDGESVSAASPIKA